MTALEFLVSEFDATEGQPAHLAALQAAGKLALDHRPDIPCSPQTAEDSAPVFGALARRQHAGVSDARQAAAREAAERVAGGGLRVLLLVAAVLAVLLGIFVLGMAGQTALRAALLLGGLAFLLLSGLPVAFAMIATACAAMLVWLPPVSLGYIGERAWGAVNTFELAAIPMFVLMGAILARGDASAALFSALGVCLGRRRGGLAQASVTASGVMAAVSGSSLATAATMGRVAGPEMVERGYSPRLAYGVLAAGGTLGILIPPSIAMIVYGPIAGVPVTQLFMAGIVPGLLMILAFALVVALWLVLRPGEGPGGSRRSLGEKLRALRGVLPF